MIDPTAQRVDAALARPDENEIAGRHLFIGLLWASIGIGAVAHVTDGGSRSSVAASAIVAASLATWLHLVHRIQRWTRSDESTGRLILMLVGTYCTLGAWLVIDSTYLIVLFGVYAITFGFVDHLPTVTVLAGIVTAMWVGAWVAYDLPTGGVITPLLVWGTLVGIAHVTSRVAQQNDERRDLLEAVRSTREQLARAEQDRGRMAERERVASEIHDTLAQGFTSIVLLSDALTTQHATLPADTLGSTLQLIGTTARENLTAARRLVEDLGPAELDQTGLADAIRGEADKHSARTGIGVHLTVSGDGRSLGGAIEVTLLRVLQEAMHNAYKHAGEHDIDVRFATTGDLATLSIADNGLGFDIDQPATAVAGTAGGHGLELMRRRTETVGGQLTVASDPGSGTSITVRLPIDGVRA